MQTSCPACHTTFRVTQAQLGLRRGLVRCSSCNAVFNAYDTLLPDLAEPPEAGESAAPESARPSTSRSSPPAAPEPVPAWSLTLPPEPAPAAEAAEASLARGPEVPHTPDAQRAPETPTPSPTPDAPDAAPEDTPAASALPAQAPSGDTPRKPAETPEDILLAALHGPNARLPLWQAALYGFGIGFLLLLLLFQAMYFLRGPLALVLPQQRPALEGFCRAFGCTVPMPRELDARAIVSSSLEHDAERTSRVRLTVLLANRTARAQEWPHLVLALSDVRENPVAQRAFSPRDYLPAHLSARSGFAAQSEQEVRLELDVGKLAAASYVVTLMYP